MFRFTCNLPATSKHRFRCCAVRRFAFGLVNNTSDDQFYARKLDLSTDVVHFTTRGQLWEAAKADARTASLATESYLQRIRKNIHEDLKGQEVKKQRQLTGILRGAMQSTGEFVMLLGGSSVGKSVVLDALARDFNKDTSGPVVVRVDGRMVDEQDLAAGLMTAIREANKETDGRLKPFFDFVEFFKPVATVAIDAGVAQILPNTGISVSNAMNTMLNPSKMTARDVLTAFAGEIKEGQWPPCLIIDEAQMVLRAEADAKTAEHTRKVLALLTSLCKEQRRLNVIIATSEHAYPLRLRRATGFNLGHLSKVLYAGEVPPQQMRDLLGKWGVEAKLRELLLASYGGHILSTSCAVSQLAIDRDAFAAEDAVAIDLHARIAACLQQEPRLPGIKDTLAQLAVRGFAPLEDPWDARAELLAGHDVGGVVARSSVVMGLPPETWEESGRRAKYGIVPASQSVRLVIADQLNVASAP